MEKKTNRNQELKIRRKNRECLPSKSSCIAPPHSPFPAITLPFQSVFSNFFLKINYHILTKGLMFAAKHILYIFYTSLYHWMVFHSFTGSHVKTCPNEFMLKSESSERLPSRNLLYVLYFFFLNCSILSGILITPNL